MRSFCASHRANAFCQALYFFACPAARSGPKSALSSSGCRRRSPGARSSFCARAQSTWNRVVGHRGEIEDLAGGIHAQGSIGEADARHAENAGLVVRRRRRAIRGQEEFLDSRGNDRTLAAARRGSRSGNRRRRCG